MKMYFEKSTLLENLNDKLMNFRSRLELKPEFQNLIKSDSIHSELESFKLSYEKATSIIDPERFKNHYEIQLRELNPYISSATGNVSKVFKAHEKSISCMISYKNNTVITGSHDKSILFWNFKDSKRKAGFENAHSDSINTMIILENTDTLVSGGDDEFIRFWDLAKMREDMNEIDNQSNVCCLIQHDSDTIIAGSSDKSFNYYDITTKKLLKKILTDHTSIIKKLLIIRNHSKNLLISGSGDHKIKIWEEDKNIVTLQEHTRRIESLIQLKFNSDIIVSGDCHGNIIFWSINDDFKILNKIKRADYIAADKKGDYSLCLLELELKGILISTTELSSLTIWDLSNYKIIRNVFLVQGIGNVLANENEEILIFNLNSNLVIWK